LYEGFGLPVLEAMACGTPVVTSNVSSLLEVAGDATLLIDPFSVQQITDALSRLLSDNTLRVQLIERGHQQASQFTWDKAAVQLRELYYHMLK
jgi:glycosyltransferase involved in cell wall biosynthesis